MIQNIYTQIRKLLVRTAPVLAAEPTNTNQPAQVAGIDASLDQLHLTDGRIFEITQYKDPYGKVCEPEDACAVEANNGNSKIKVEFYSTRYTLH
jgi:hypothetical protein